MLNRLRPLATLAAAALSLNAYSAVDMFLKIEGIKGEADDPAHKGEIDVLAWSWGMSQSGSFHVGAGGGAGKANFQDLSVTKWVDISSVTLMEHVATGKHIDEATLVVRNGGEKSPTTQELVLYKILVTSSSTGGSGGEDMLTENVTLNFESFCITYTQDLDGSKGKQSKLCWNIAANQTCSVAQVDTLYKLPLVRSLPRHVMADLNPVCSNT